MKRNPQHQNATEETESEAHVEAEMETPFKDDSDICQQLMSRYSTSKAPQHRHLLATAAAIRSILSAESLPLTPPTYFAAAMDNLSDYETLDSTAIGALLSFLSIVVPLIPKKGIKGDKASEAVGVLVKVVEREGLGVASVRGVVKCLGVLVAGFCDLEVWGSSKEGFQALLKFSIDKRPKVRKSAQDCLEKFFKHFQSSTVNKEASKLVHSLLKSYMPGAVALSELRIFDGSKDETLSKHKHLEVLHVLNLLKVTIPYLSGKISSKVLPELVKLIGSHFSELTRPVFNSIEAVFETSRDEVTGPQTENIIDSLSLYVSSGKENPEDTLISAASLLRTALDKLHARGSSSWMRDVLRVFGSIAGLLMFEASTASKASDILKELISKYMDGKILFADENRSFEDVNQESMGVDMIRSICAIFEGNLSSCSGIPNEHLLGVITVLFQKLGDSSFIYMKSIVLMLADLINQFSQDSPDSNHLQNCIGSAVVAMGPERILTLIPISININNFTCSNIWLIPILKAHVVGASLEYFMEHIVPLAKSFQRASRKVKKSVIGQDLHSHAHDLWGLLPSFCRSAIDTHTKFESLAKLLITCLQKNFMCQNVALALQVLVNQNRSVLTIENKLDESNSNEVMKSDSGFKNKPSYSKKTATRNIRTLASCSTELLPVLAYLFVDSLPEERSYLKDAIGCLASITDSSVTEKVFMSLLERFQFVNGEGEFEKLQSHSDELIDGEQLNPSGGESNVSGGVMMELATSLVEGAKEDLINQIYKFIIYVFQATDVTGQCEAYRALNRILEEHVWFRSSRSAEVIDLLLSLKPSVDIASLTNRFACFCSLMAHVLEMEDEENLKAFLILNEIILTLKDGKDEARKVAYDTLLMISSLLRNSSHVNSGGVYQRLLKMIMGYLSGSSPHITSGAVSALSILIYNDTEICLTMPDLVPSLLSLLKNKAVEVVKAVLGFVKVIVSCLQAKNLQNILSDIISGVLPWSSVSRHHFRSKVTIILEIVIRKCGSAAVELVTPEKYKSFVKNVQQNRHHKSTSKEAGSDDMETVVAGPSSKRVEKQELGSMPDGNDLIHHGKRKWDKKQKESSRHPGKTAGHNGGLQRAKRARHSTIEKSIRSQSEDVWNKKNNGKRKMETRNMSKKGEVAFHRFSSASKINKHKKATKKE